jgi:hypothetical protein
LWRFKHVPSAYKNLEKAVGVERDDALIIITRDVGFMCSKKNKIKSRVVVSKLIRMELFSLLRLLFFRFNPGLNMATIRQAINETIERGISNKCVSIFMHDFDLLTHS